MILLIGTSLCGARGGHHSARTILAQFSSHVGTLESGPLDAAKAYEAIIRSLVHCLLVLGPDSG